MVGGGGVVLIPDLYIHSTRPLLIMCMLMGCQQKHGRMNIKTIIIEGAQCRISVA